MLDVLPQSTRRPAARFARRYGSTFNSFDHLANVSLCSQKLGQVNIDCRFRHSKTKWGVLGSADQAGILYMDFSFAQSKDCRLSSASVWVSLEDPECVKETIRFDAVPSQSTSREGAAAHRGRSRTGVAPNPRETEGSNIVRDENEDEAVRSMYLPRLTDNFGPRQLVGEPTPVTTKKIMHLTPQVNVLGNGGGGLGLDRERNIEQTSRWTFTGNLLPGSRLGKHATDIVYRTLKWELSEDNFQPQTTRSNPIQTAFTFKHNKKPFIIRIEIQGKLESTHDRIRNHMKQLLRFPMDPSKNQGISLTVVNPQQEKATKRLDAIAKGLPSDMERLNGEAAPPQLPTTLPISFEETTRLSRDESTTTATAVEENNTGLSPADHVANALLPSSRVPGRIPSFPQVDEVIMGDVLRNEIPIKPRHRVTQSPALKRPRTEPSSPRNPPEQNPSHDEATCKRHNENHPDTPRDSRVEDVLVSKPVEDKPSQEELNELALQLVQFPFLLRIMLWILSMMSSTQNKAPRKTLKMHDAHRDTS